MGAKSERRAAQHLTPNFSRLATDHRITRQKPFSPEISQKTCRLIGVHNFKWRNLNEFSDKVRNPSFRDRLIKAGAIQSALQQDLIRQNLNQRLALLAKAFFSSLDGKFATASVKDVTDSLKPDLTQQAASALGLTSSRVTLHYLRYKVTPAQLGELDTIVTARGFRRIGGIMDVISVHQFPKSKQSPNSKLCLAIEVDRNRKDPTLTLAGVGFMGKKPADFAAAGNFLKSEPGSRQFGALLAHKHLAAFTQLPGVAIELTDTSLQAIWEAVAQSGKR